MKKKFFILAIAFLSLISNPAFCREGEEAKEGSSVSKSPRILMTMEKLVPLQKKEKGFHERYEPVGEKPKIGGVDEEKERKEKPPSKIEQKEKPKINDLVEFLKSAEVTIPQELMHIRICFSQLEGEDLVEQYQYDKLISAYNLVKARKDGSKNPAAIAILSETGYVKGSAVAVAEQDLGSIYHSEHKLITSLAADKGYELKGFKIGLYTLNSPCILRINNDPLDKYQPCISYINFIVTEAGRAKNPVLFLDSATPAAGLMTQYDLIYDDPRSNQEKYISSHNVNLEKIKHVLLNITMSKKEESKKILDQLYGKGLNKHQVMKKLLRFDLGLNSDQTICREAKSFSEISALTFIGTAFSKVYSTDSSFLIFTDDIRKLSLSNESYRTAEDIVNKFLDLPAIKILEEIQIIKKYLMECYLYSQ